MFKLYVKYSDGRRVTYQFNTELAFTTAMHAVRIDKLGDYIAAYYDEDLEAA